MKSAIITGASKGIGEALAKHLAKKNYNLLLISRNERLLEKLKNYISSINTKIYVQFEACDVFNKEELQSHIINFSKKVGGISLLINNAGYVKRGTSELSEEAFSEMINTNLIGAINVIQSVIPIMKEKKAGNIINLSSRNAKIPRSFLGGYAATKSALLAYSESLYKELSEYGIKVTALCPGFVDTDMTSEVTADRALLIPTLDICKTLDYLLALSPSTAIKEIGFESIIQVGSFC